jgi:hypothetical protein
MRLVLLVQLQLPTCKFASTACTAIRRAREPGDCVRLLQHNVAAIIMRASEGLASKNELGTMSRPKL